MTRISYRLSLTALCALAAFGGPVLFLEDQPRVRYLAGGLFAAFLAWGLLIATVAMEESLQPEVQGILGAGAAVLSWATVSLVAVLDVIPHALQHGPALFDPVWVMGGLSPLIVPTVAWWRYRRKTAEFWPALASALLRYSLPLFGLELVFRVAGLAKQFRWLFLFTGMMFLVLDGLGMGTEQRPDGEGRN